MLQVHQGQSVSASTHSFSNNSPSYSQFCLPHAHGNMLRPASHLCDAPRPRFDVILIDPPWEEYARRAPAMVEDDEVWSWEQIMELDISGIADTPCFVFL